MEKGPISTPVSIILGSIILSIAILMHGGVIQVGNVQLNNPGVAKASSKPTAPQPSAAVKANVDVGYFPALGDKNAKVKVIEFADFQCPFCEKFHNDAEKQMIKDYVDTGKVQFYYRNFAFLGEESTWAAEAAFCANEQNKFWEYHDYLFGHQGAENSGAFTKEKLGGFAKEIGLDMAKFTPCLETDKYATQVADDKKAGEDSGVNGTPATFINGTLISGAVPYASFKQSIEAALK